jgi:hypothetical protein
VTGPASAIQNAIAVYADTTGKVLASNAAVVATAKSMALNVTTNNPGADFYIGSDTFVLSCFDSCTANGFQLFRRSRGTQAARTNVVDTDVIGNIRFDAFSGTSMDTCAIQGAVQGAVVNGQRPGSAFLFYTNIPNGNVTLNASLDNTGVWAAKGFAIQSGAAGIDASITAANFGVKTITVSKGIITGFA